MLSDDHRAVMAALKALARPATLLEIAEATELPPFHARACLHQLGDQKMVAGLFGERVRWQLTARGYCEAYEHEAVDGRTRSCL